MPQNVVSGGAMEIKVGHHEVNQVGLAFEAHRVFTERQPDVTILRAINVPGFEGLHEGQCLASRALRSAKVFSVSSCFGTSTPASRAAAPLARSAAICSCRTNGNMSGASR